MLENVFRSSNTLPNSPQSVSPTLPPNKINMHSTSSQLIFDPDDSQNIEQSKYKQKKNKLCAIAIVQCSAVRYKTISFCLSESSDTVLVQVCVQNKQQNNETKQQQTLQGSRLCFALIAQRLVRCSVSDKCLRLVMKDVGLGCSSICGQEHSQQSRPIFQVDCGLVLLASSPGYQT